MYPSDGGQSGREPQETGAPSAHARLERVSLQAAVAWLEVRRRTTPARQLAEEIGIGKSSVDKVLKEGAVPRKNAPKMIRWFLRDRQARYGSLHDPADVAALVSELLAHIPATARSAALRRLADFLEALHRDTGAPRPGWLDALGTPPAGDPEAGEPPPARYPRGGWSGAGGR